LGEVFGEKIHKIMDLALKLGCPMIGLNDGAGARIKKGSCRSTRTAASSTATCSRRASSHRSASSSGHVRWSGLQPRDDRLHLHGARDVAHVHHRSRRGQDR
jgi:hypothetical protein